MSLWNTLLYQPLLNLLMFVYQAVGDNLGLAIIVVTILVRLILISLTLPSMASAQKMQDLKPELDKLKKKHGDDKQAFAQAQMELFRKHKINPLGSLLPTIVQLLMLIALFQAFNNTLKPIDGVGELNNTLYSFVRLPENARLNTQFLYLNVTEPDRIQLPSPIALGPLTISYLPGFFVIGAALVQFISSRLMIAKKTITQKQVAQKEAQGEDMATTMQQQMSIIAPLMTLVLGIQFASGLVLYWFMFSVTMIIQQFYLKRKPLRAAEVSK